MACSVAFGPAAVRADAHVVVIFNLQAPAAAATDAAILAHELAVQVNAADGYEARIEPRPHDRTLREAAAAAGAREYVDGRLSGTSGAYHLTLAVFAANGERRGQSDTDLPASLILPASVNALALVHAPAATPVGAPALAPAASTVRAPSAMTAPLMLTYSERIVTSDIPPPDAPAQQSAPAPDIFGGILAGVVGQAAGQATNILAPSLNAGGLVANAVTQGMTPSSQAPGNVAMAPAPGERVLSDQTSTLRIVIGPRATRFERSIPRAKGLPALVSYDVADYTNRTLLTVSGAAPAPMTRAMPAAATPLAAERAYLAMTNIPLCYIRNEHPDGATTNVLGHKAFHQIGTIVASPGCTSANGTGNVEAWVGYVDPATLADLPPDDPNALKVYFSIAVAESDNGSNNSPTTRRYAVGATSIGPLPPNTDLLSAVPPPDTTAQLAPLATYAAALTALGQFDQVLPYSGGYTQHAIQQLTMDGCKLTLTGATHYPAYSSDLNRTVDLGVLDIGSLAVSVIDQTTFREVTADYPASPFFGGINGFHALDVRTAATDDNATLAAFRGAIAQCWRARHPA
jgi:hypothetical protein